VTRGGDWRDRCEEVLRRYGASSGPAHAEGRAPSEALALRASGLGVWELDLAAGELLATPRFFDLLGVDDGALSWCQLVERIHPHDRARVLDALDSHLEGLWPFDVECRIRVRVDEHRWFRLTAQAEWSATQEATRASGTLEDVTARRDAEEAVRRSEADLRRAAEALRESEGRFRQLAENMDDLFWLEDLSSGEVIYVNAATERIGIGSPEEFLRDSGAVWRGRIRAEDHPRTAGLVDGPSPAAIDATFRIEDEREAVRWIHARTFPICDAEGLPYRRGGIAQDVTSFRRTQDQLREAQKLESIGQLAAGVAHEINTPVQYVGDNMRFLESSVTDLLAVVDAALEAAAAGDDTARCEGLARVVALAEEGDVDYLRTEIPTAIAQALDGTAQVARIVAAMKQFSHPGCEDERSMVDVNQTIDSAATIARGQYKYAADMSLDLDPRLCAVPAHAGPLGQVIVNMIVNAVHAIEERNGDSGGRGTITIATRDRGEHVEVRVADTGSGIPEHVQGKVFDPFFTTKGVGRGTGQGLSLAWTTIVERHHGKLWFETVPGEGTTFFVLLPKRAAESEQAA
jgi:signal transduction histidine kinase